MKQLIAAIIFIGTAASIFWVWTTPIINDIKSLNADRAALEDILSRFQSLRQTKNDLIQSYNAISSKDLAGVKAMIPEKTDEGGLIVAFENMAKDNGLLLKQLDIRHKAKESGTVMAAPKEPYDTLSITLSVDGPYGAFKSFLSDLERSTRIIDVNSISFNAGEKDSYEFVMTASAYYQRQ